MCVACSGGFTEPVSEATFEFLSSDRDKAMKAKIQQCSTVKQANLPLFA